jgi:hypothetical protein
MGFPFVCVPFPPKVIAGLLRFAVSVDNHDVAHLENLRLKVFRTVAEHLNFRKAAEHLFLTSPPVTHQIKALEDGLGRTRHGGLLDFRAQHRESSSRKQ